MRHRATIYSLGVHERGKPNIGVPFGDIDGSGTYLAEFLEGVFGTGFESLADDKQREVRCASCLRVDPELRVMFRPGERGIRADIMDENGQLELRQEPKHTQILDCGSLFHLPRNATSGFWATHVNNSRSVHSLVKREMVRQFRETFDDRVLTISPCVSADLLLQALKQNRLLSMNLYKHDQSSDIGDRGKWARDKSPVKLELAIKPASAGQWLRTNLLRQYYSGKKRDEATFGQIVEYGGIKFDEARCQVQLENGDRRTFNIQDPENGYAMSEDISPKANANDDLVPDSVFSELRRVLKDLT